MRVYHATTPARANKIIEQGAKAIKAVGAIKTVWVCTPGMRVWAYGHANRRHRANGEVSILEFNVPRSWLIRGGRKGLWHTGGRDVPPEMIVSVTRYVRYKGWSR